MNGKCTAMASILVLAMLSAPAFAQGRSCNEKGTVAVSQSKDVEPSLPDSAVLKNCNDSYVIEGRS